MFKIAFEGPNFRFREAGFADQFLGRCCDEDGAEDDHRAQSLQ